MDRRNQLVFGMAAALLCWLSMEGTGLAQNLPDGAGKAEFTHNCLDCHSAGMVLRAKKTPEDWRKNVDDMAARGSDGSKEDIDKVYLYLVKNFSTETPGPATQTPTVPPARTIDVSKRNAEERSMTAQQHLAFDPQQALSARPWSTETLLPNGSW